ncbi:MAG TPA: hypothetical protein VFE15_05790 [Marmoricola sp.]|nr:hypothetical protein [Marmoricola sp.]
MNQDDPLAGSHRAPRSTSRAAPVRAPEEGGHERSRQRNQPARTRSRRSKVSRTAVIVAVVIALLPAAVLGVVKLFGGSDSARPQHRTVLPIPPVTTPAATAPVTPTPTPTTRPPAQPHLPHVALDVPRRLLSSGLLNVGFDDSVEPSSAGTFRARSSAEVARWGTRGEPGMPAKDTVVVVGKTFTEGQSAFDTLPQVKTGARIVIRTDSGDLTYTVRSTAIRPAAGLASTVAFTRSTPGRLYVIGIEYDRSGRLTGKDFVVLAEITGAIAR